MTQYPFLQDISGRKSINLNPERPSAARVRSSWLSNSCSDLIPAANRYCYMLEGWIRR